LESQADSLGLAMKLPCLFGFKGLGRWQLAAPLIFGKSGSLLSLIFMVRGGRLVFVRLGFICVL